MMIDLKDFLPQNTRIIVKDDYLLISKSGMRKLMIRRFLRSDDLPVFFFALGLFAGEGRDRFTKTTERIEFVNSYLPYVKIFQRFLEIINLGNLIRPRIQLKSDLNYESVLDFWSKNLNIPPERFSRPLISQKKKKTENKTRIAPFGSIIIRLDSALAYKITKYWIQTLIVNEIDGPAGI